MILKYIARGKRSAWPVLIVACIFVLATLCLITVEPAFWSWTNFLQTESPFGHSAPINCYDDKISNKIEDISDVPPLEKDTIFFHETSCASAAGNGDFVFSPRQACAVESAAKENPNAEVNVLFLSPISLNSVFYTHNPVIRALFNYSNIRFKHVNFENYVKGTPLERWYRTGALKKSLWPTSHASDVMRYLTLWKYSGTYLDLDVVVLKSLSTLSNYAGAESPRNIGAGVINLDSSNTGRSIAHLFLRELLTGFSGTSWGANGPGVITRALQQLCHVKKVQDMTPEHCGGFSVHPPTAFYPVSFESWDDYFDESNSNTTLKKHVDSYVAHLSNKFSAKRPVKVGSKQPYALLAAKHCPQVYATCESVF